MLSLICGYPCWDIVSCLNVVVHVFFVCLVVVWFDIVLDCLFVCRCCGLYCVEWLVFKVGRLVGWLVIIDCYCVFVFVVQVLFSGCVVVYFTGRLYVCCCFTGCCLFHRYVVCVSLFYRLLLFVFQVHCMCVIALQVVVCYTGTLYVCHCFTGCCYLFSRCIVCVPLLYRLLLLFVFRYIACVLLLYRLLLFIFQVHCMCVIASQIVVCILDTLHMCHCFAGCGLFCWYTLCVLLFNRLLFVLQVHFVRVPLFDRLLFSRRI